MQYASLKFLEVLVEVTHSIQYSVLSSISSLMSLLEVGECLWVAQVTLKNWVHFTRPGFYSLFLD